MALNTNSAFKRLYTDSLFCYQQFDFRQIRKLRVGQTNVDVDAEKNCRLYAKTRKATKFQNEFHSITNDHFEDHYVLVFELISRQDKTAKLSSNTTKVRTADFPHFQNRLVPLQRRSPVFCRVNIGYRLQTLSTNCILQTISRMNSRVSSSSTSSR